MQTVIIYYLGLLFCLCSHQPQLILRRGLWQQHRSQRRDSHAGPRQRNAQDDHRFEAGLYELGLVHVLHLVLQGSPAVSLLQAHVGHCQPFSGI